MSTKQMIEHRNDKGIAMVTTLLLSLLLSILVGAMLMSSTADTLISGNDVRTNQAFYIAEAGINRAAGWFSAKFATDPNSGLFILPEQNPSNSTGTPNQLSYTDPPYYRKGEVSTSPEQSVPTSVKVKVSGNLQNVVLAGTGDSSNTYPTSYTVRADDTSGVQTTFNYNNVVTDFTDHLVNQPEGVGQFSVKATLVSIIPPNGEVQGTITWLIQSTGKIVRPGNKIIATSTLYGYMSANVTAVNRTVQTHAANLLVAAAPGVIGRSMVTWNDMSAAVDSYKSSKGKYNAPLAANSYPGQIGASNKGSRGDLRTNNESFPELNNGNPGYIDIQNGTITGNVYATFQAPGNGGPPNFNAISIRAGHVRDGRGGDFNPATNAHYGENALDFQTISNPPTPAAGASDYSWAKNQNGTLPAGNWKNISVTKGTLTVPPGNYGVIDVASQGTIVLGVQGQQSVYNLQGFTGNAQATIVYKGPVTINVQSSLDAGAGTDVVNSPVPPSSIRWNFVGGSNQRIYIGGHGAVVGVFYAPNNDLQIRGTGDFFGAIAARSVDLRGSGNIHVDEDAISSVQRIVPQHVAISSLVGYTATNYNLWRITQSLN
ncbi:MAG TPA: PilX N-terminal domain-containing pilus assembly protein [Blastocatellia bacterium]|nr:PilX N-terminal domain-containing pilus assembly protein [Blastocatellia bacterium]